MDPDIDVGVGACGCGAGDRPRAFVRSAAGHRAATTGCPASRERTAWAVSRGTWSFSTVVCVPESPADPALSEPVGFESLHGRLDDVVERLGDAFPVVRAYADLLADQGVLRGLIGPRELPRLWERHVLNSAAVAPFLPAGGVLVDVGSGAGLPGVVLAALRPDLATVLVEPMERRVTWLEEVVDALGLGNVRVVRARADELHGTLEADVVTARAVAALDRLAGWTLPLLREGGVLLALKGRQAGDELAAARARLTTLGGNAGEVLEAEVLPGLETTRVVRIERIGPVTSGPAAAPPSNARRRRGRRRE